MRRQTKLTLLTIVCALIITACGQQASVGVPTPDAAALAVAAATATAAVASSTPVPPPQPTSTAASPSVTETATSVPPTQTPVPSTAEPAATAAVSNIACNKQIVHVVKPGENLFRIALRYRTTITAIARLNRIANVRSIRTGQRLRIVTCAR